MPENPRNSDREAGEAAGSGYSRLRSRGSRIPGRVPDGDVEKKIQFRQPAAPGIPGDVGPGDSGYRGVSDRVGRQCAPGTEEAAGPGIPGIPDTEESGNGQAPAAGKEKKIQFRDQSVLQRPAAGLRDSGDGTGKPDRVVEKARPGRRSSRPPGIPGFRTGARRREAGRAGTGGGAGRRPGPGSREGREPGAGPAAGPGIPGSPASGKAAGRPHAGGPGRAGPRGPGRRRSQA